jgi:predicted RNA-binding protein
MEARNYWLNLFNVKTWGEFLDAGGEITGFRERHWNLVQQIKPEDYLICYLTGASRFVGLLEVISVPFLDNAPIWKGEDFPCRIKVRSSVILTPSTAVPVLELKEHLSIFNNLKNPNAWAAYFRRSPASIKDIDAKSIINALKKAEKDPIHRPLEQQKIIRSLNYIK